MWLSKSNIISPKIVSICTVPWPGRFVCCVSWYLLKFEPGTFIWSSGFHELYSFFPSINTACYSIRLIYISTSFLYISQCVFDIYQPASSDSITGLKLFIRKFQRTWLVITEGIQYDNLSFCTGNVWSISELVNQLNIPSWDHLFVSLCRWNNDVILSNGNNHDNVYTSWIHVWLHYLHYTLGTTCV